VPELPETETIARDLDGAIRGRKITNVSVRKADVLREVTARVLAKKLRNATILRSWRRAKLVVLDLDTGDHLVVQPRFTGALLIDDGSFTGSELRYSTLRLELDDGRFLHYADVRRLGTVALMNAKRFDEYSGKLGIEPLDRAFTGRHLSGVLRASSQPVKKLLMEQRKDRRHWQHLRERGTLARRYRSLAPCRVGVTGRSRPSPRLHRRRSR